MFGIFQLFSINVFFWTVVGALRFIFETIHAIWRVPRARTRPYFFIAAGAGLSMAAALFSLFLAELHFTESVRQGASNAIAFPGMALWLLSVAFGSYIAARLFTRNPYVAAYAVSLGAIAAGISLVSFTETGVLFFASQSIGVWVGWMFLTVCAGLLGGYSARGVNIFEDHQQKTRLAITPAAQIKPHEVAIVIAAHNEEVSIAKTIRSLLAITTPENIYVGSDGSKDRTVEIVRSFGCHADDIQPNRGKAGALTYVLEHNNILDRYKAVFFIDADITVDPDFYTYTLPAFHDPNVVAVSGYFEAIWPRHIVPRWELLVSAYRIRLWRVLQFLVRYGQTWRYLNVSPIIPGGGSIYRTSALKHITIHVPGLIIEDFNMTFEVHHKKLGLIVFEPRARLYDQEPYSIGDFIKQIKRWYLGYFQTMRHHGVWPSFFCFFTYFFTLELLVSSFLFLLFPFFLLELLIGHKEFLFINLGLWGYQITIFSLVLTVFVADYLITAAVAAIERKPILLIYGIAFFPLRYVEAVVFLSRIPVTFLGRSDGTWKSPERKTF